MELNKFTEDVATKHVDKSLVEMTDDEKVARWQSGERAAEQANEIVDAIVREAMEALEAKESQDESK